MCGICGVVGPGMSHDDLKAFKSLLWVTSLRGEHSTGVYSYISSRPKKQKHRLRKRLGPSPLFILEDDTKSRTETMLDSVMNDVLFGHCRYATKGKITIDNAHPFDTGRYVGMHNGTLVDAKYRHETKTDSEMMFEDVESRGVVPVLNDLDWMSAYAISLFDKRTEDLIFATNGDRPLSFAVNTERRVLYFASELSALKYVTSRHRIEVDFYTFEKDKVYTVNLRELNPKDHAFWSIEDLSPQTVADKKFDWSTMDWLESDYQGPKSDVIRSCCCCGTVLENDALKKANIYKFHDQVYLTCESCMGDGVAEQEEKEVKVG